MTAQQQYTEHLLALRRAEVASDLEQQGYRVEANTRLDNQKADLVASKPGKTLVYKFTLPASLHSNSDQIRQLRRMAAERGFEFKLVVVTPPRRVKVAVEGLDRALYDSFRRFPGSSFSSLASQVIVEDVTDVEITSLNNRGELTDIAGQGAVEVRLEYGGGDVNDGLTSYDTFPFKFDVTMDSQHKVVAIRALDVDTSSFNE